MSSHDFNLEVTGTAIHVIHDDLGTLIAAERQPSEGGLLSTIDAAINSTWFTSYHPYQDHLQFLEDLVARNPDRSEIITSGTSYDGNPISAIHIYGSSGKGIRPAVVFHGTVHAREWITTMVCQIVRLIGIDISDNDNF